MGKNISESGTRRNNKQYNYLYVFVRLKGLHSSLNLALLLDPSDESSRLLVARIQLHLGVDLDEVLKAEMFIYYF